MFVLVAALDSYIYERALAALESISASDRREIYVVSFFVSDEEDDPRRPTLTVGFNSESDVASAWGDPAEDEARWNYAFFRQNALAVLFSSQEDPDGARFRDAMTEEAGYSFPGEDDLATAVTAPWFVANAVFAARRLHEEGDISRIFGKTIPVLVHELEYYDTIAMQNMAANPPGVADDFVRWCRSQ